MRRALALAAALLFSSGCAALFHSQRQSVLFTSQPPSSEVLIDGRSYGKTPLSVNLKQDDKYTVTFRAAGYEDRSYRLDNHVGAGWILLDVVGGLIPVAIDAVTGSWYSLDDTSVHGTLAVSNIPGSTDSVTVGSAPSAEPDRPRGVQQVEYGGTPLPKIPSAPVTVGLTDGSLIAAKSVEPAGENMIKVTPLEGKARFMSTNKVRTVVDVDGTDWTVRVLEERARVPKR